MQTRITVNGREYASVADMPPEVRQQYERAMSVLADKDGNGVPDVLEGLGAVESRTFDDDGNAVVSSEVTSSHYVINGKSYARLEDVPAELRELIRRATAGSLESSEQPAARELSFNVGARSTRHLPLNETGGGGITIRLTWPLLFAVLTVALIALVIAWFVTR